MGRLQRSLGSARAAAMNFSETFKLSGQLCKFSPNGKYLVSGRGDRKGLGAQGGACTGWRQLGNLQPWMGPGELQA